MNRLLGVVRKTVLATAFATSLGFGATQAFAKVQLSLPDYYLCVPNEPYRSDDRCFENCVSRGYFYGGECNAAYTACMCDERTTGWSE